MRYELPTWDHSALGASKAERWMNCPGSVRMSRDLPNEQTIYAAEGTVGHEVAARALSSKRDVIDWLDDEFVTGDYVIVFDHELAEAVQEYVDYVRTRQQLLKAELLVEHTFSLAPLRPPEDMFGTSDATLVIAGGRFFEIIDLKLGAGVVVDPEENAQLMYYALGAILELRHDLRSKPERIKATIVQPRAYHADGPVRTYEFTWDQLVAFQKELFAKAAQTQEPDAPLQAGPWCRFCPAQPVCPAQKAHAVALAQTEFDDLPVTGIPAPAQLSTDDLVEVLEKGHIIEDWLRAVRLHVQSLLEAGESVPGWKLVERRAVRKWANDEDPTSVVAFATAHGVDENDMYSEPKLKSPAQVEALLKKQLPRGRKKEAPELLEASGLVEKKSSGNTIAPTKDARPEIPSTVEQDFESLPDMPGLLPPGTDTEES